MSTETVTHRDMLRRLSAGDKRALTERSDRRGLGQLAGHLSLIGLCLWGNVVGEGAVRWGAMLGQRVGMVFLFTAMHECSHSTAFHSRRLNRAIGMLAGLTLLIGPNWFFYFHQDHHKFTQNPNWDPELDTPKPSGVGGYLAYLSGVPFWVGNMRVILGNATGRRNYQYVPEHMQNAVRHGARVIYERDLGHDEEMPVSRQNRGSVWSLLGLVECYEKLGDSRAGDAGAALAAADQPVTSSCFCRGRGGGSGVA